jgi:hypothetical protein
MRARWLSRAVLGITLVQIAAVDDDPFRVGARGSGPLPRASAVYGFHRRDRVVGLQLHAQPQ